MLLADISELRNRVLAVWKWCLSFHKSDWEMQDYPIAIRTQDTRGWDLVGSRFELPKYTAAIVNWWVLGGSGNTKQEAIADLKRNFETRKTHILETGVSLPRPGTHVPIEFASTARVSLYSECAKDFVRRVLDVEWAFITDESTLWEFHGNETNEMLFQKIRELYGVDVST